MSSEKHSGMHKKIPPRRDAELADFGQGSGVTPDSDKAILRSRVVRRTAGTCPAGALRE